MNQTLILNMKCHCCQIIAIIKKKKKLVELSHWGGGVIVSTVTSGMASKLKHRTDHIPDRLQPRKLMFDSEACEKLTKQHEFQETVFAISCACGR